MARQRIALLSNPRSTGNIAQLPRIRAFCAEHPDSPLREIRFTLIDDPTVEVFEAEFRKRFGA